MPASSRAVERSVAERNADGAMQAVDDRTNVAGTNRLEVLMFRFEAPGEEAPAELFDVKVSKVRELIDLTELTRKVDGIAALNWGDVVLPPDILTAERASVLTAISMLKDVRMQLILNVEKVLADSAVGFNYVFVHCFCFRTASPAADDEAFVLGGRGAALSVELVENCLYCFIDVCGGDGVLIQSLERPINGPAFGDA